MLAAAKIRLKMMLKKRSPNNLLTKIVLLAWILSGSKALFAAEDDLYDYLWLDPDKKVYVLQNKVYKKKSKFYANIGFSRGLNSDFQSTTGVQFKGGYYFHEEWAVEAIYHQYSSTDNDAFTNLQRINQSVPFVRRINKKFGVMPVWSPFYGKINTFNKIIYFDWSFGLGLGQIQTESNANSVGSAATADIFSDETNMAILGKTAFRIHATQNVHIGIEYHRDHYRAPGPVINNVPGTEKWRSNSELVFSIGFSF